MQQQQVVGTFKWTARVIGNRLCMCSIACEALNVGTFVSLNALYNLMIAQWVFFVEFRFFFRANEPDFTVAISHMQWHATQVYSVERKKGYTLLHARRKKHHHQKTYWFWNVYTHPKLIRMQSMFKWKKKPIARLMLNIALSLHLIDEMFSVFMFRQLSIITLCVRTFWLYTRYAGYQSRSFL